MWKSVINLWKRAVIVVIIVVKCVEVLWSKRAYHKERVLSTTPPIFSWDSHKPLDSLRNLLYNTEEPTTSPMNTSHAEKQQIRVTLDFEVFADFDVHQIDFDKVFDIGGGENLTVTVEDLSENVEELWAAAYL